MNYIEALKHLRKGDRATLKEWINADEVKYISRCIDSSRRDYGTIRLTSMRNDKFHYSHLFTDIDLMINGVWEIYQESPKLHTFEEAVAALKAGKKIYRKFLNLTTNYTGKGDFLFAFNKEDIFANDWIILN